MKNRWKTIYFKHLKRFPEFEKIEMLIVENRYYLIMLKSYRGSKIWIMNEKSMFFKTILNGFPRLNKFENHKNFDMFYNNLKGFPKLENLKNRWYLTTCYSFWRVNNSRSSEIWKIDEKSIISNHVKGFPKLANLKNL